MILVKSIETIEVPGDMHDLYQDFGFQGTVPCYLKNGEPHVENIEVTAELVRGRRFRRADSQTVCIGMTREIQDILGLQYEAWDRTQDDLDSKRNEVYSLSCKVNGLQKELSDLRETTFWKKLTGLFKND